MSEISDTHKKSNRATDVRNVRCSKTSPTRQLAMRDVFMRPGRARMYAENDDVIYVSSFGEKSHTKSRHMAAISSLSWSEINLLFSHKLGRRFRGFFFIIKDLTATTAANFFPLNHHRHIILFLLSTWSENARRRKTQGKVKVTRRRRNNKSEAHKKMVRD